MLFFFKSGEYWNSSEFPSLGQEYVYTQVAYQPVFLSGTWRSKLSIFKSFLQHKVTRKSRIVTTGVKWSSSSRYIIPNLAQGPLKGMSRSLVCCAHRRKYLCASLSMHIEATRERQSVQRVCLYSDSVEINEIIIRLLIQINRYVFCMDLLLSGTIKKKYLLTNSYTCPKTLA